MKRFHEGASILDKEDFQKQLNFWIDSCHRRGGQVWCNGDCQNSLLCKLVSDAFPNLLNQYFTERNDA